MIQKVMNEADEHCMHMHVCMCVYVLIIDTRPGRAIMKNMRIDTMYSSRHTYSTTYHDTVCTADVVIGGWVCDGCGMMYKMSDGTNDGAGNGRADGTWQ